MKIGHICLIFCTVLLGMFFFMPGCAVFKDLEAGRNRDRLNELHMGMSHEQVVEYMGKPWKTEAFMSKGNTYTVLYYLTQRIPDGATTDDEMTPLILKDGSLIGWGRRFFSDIRVEIKNVDD